MNKTGEIIRVSGPLVVASGMSGSRMYDVVRVSRKNLIGEIIELKGDIASIQVYEETSGIGPGEPVFSTHEPLSVELGPGLIGSIYDGVQRPLDDIMKQIGNSITRGISLPGLDREHKWEFKPIKKEGDKVNGGDIIGEVQETVLVTHKIMIPPDISGRIVEIKKGKFTVTDVVCVLETENGKRDITLLQKWPVRKARPYIDKLPPDIPMYTGQRVIDTFFPVAKGGTACVPGPFGSGKTVIQHQVSKWAEADIILFVGCGERGNEMTDVLIEFPELKDPQSGEPLMKRTILVANTSNMPVAARETSVYTGMTIAEYFRDMGYSVTLQADSTSRWAEAMREISGRLEEMPGEEGYPAYLGTRVAEFYERAGKVRCLGEPDREGFLTVIGSVSPPGGDLADPVVQSTLRVVKVFWDLQDRLASARHFPAIDWLSSYSLYIDSLKKWVEENIEKGFQSDVKDATAILEREAELQEIVRLVGIESLSSEERLLLEIARSIREDFLHQNAFHEVDTYTSTKKQQKMLSSILHLYKKGHLLLKSGKTIEDIVKLPIWERIARMKYIDEKKIEEIDKIKKEIDGVR
ncbi:MAG: V-type ATP synthase subunit A [bacterium (Candidatus Stahlbacteria) CG23_combo_of_CG06-09_8_20_14_all_40_9]|nr:MAG: V-type ATP synthase subunit A [bacterium (Candidatus Stahlbacteria) CG23_combo_of_CG06-09_8_20_14_all_40_9]